MNRKRIVFGIFALIILISMYIGISYSKIQSVYSADKSIMEKIKDMSFMVGGQTVGIKLLASRCACYGC